MKYMYLSLLFAMSTAAIKTEEAIEFVPSSIDTQHVQQKRKATLKTYLKILSAIVGAAEVLATVSHCVKHQFKHKNHLFDAHGDDAGKFVIGTFWNVVKIGFAILSAGNAIYMFKDGAREIRGEDETLQIKEQKSHIANQIQGLLGIMPAPIGLFSVINGVYRIIDSIKHAE